jgi:hypothetical protein
MNYHEAYGEMHAANRDHFAGLSIMPHVPAITALIKRHGSKTLLDYGCGKGHQYVEAQVHETFGIMPALYDPGVKAFARRPKQRYDGVICTDVMEHIEHGDVKAVLRDVFRYSRHWVFFSISTRAAKKTLPDGRNVHLTIKPGRWWDEKIKKAAKGRPFEVVYVD